jgi:dihydroneopterin aldolase
MQKKPLGTRCYHSLSIEGYRLPVLLGIEESERSKLQDVLIDLEFRFRSPPKAITTDQLKDTICYSDICLAMRNFSKGKEFKLIENLTQDLYKLISKSLRGKIPFSIQVTKMKAPVENLLGGAKYRIADFP